MKLLKAGDHRVMPWKNGKGVTREIARDDGGAEAFDWRISIATIAGPGPFSLFPGIDRTLAMLTGGGLRLTGEGIDAALMPNGAGLAFSGDIPVFGEPLGGESLDLNVMTRRGRFTHSLNPITVDGEGDETVPEGLTFSILNAPATLVVEGRTFDLATHDVVTGLSPGTRLQWHAAAPAVVYRATILAA